MSDQPTDKRRDTLGDAPGYAIPQDVQEWIWHMDTHLDEHDVRHAGLALRSAWPAVRDFFASMRSELIQLRNRLAGAKAALYAELQAETTADAGSVKDYENRAVRRCIDRLDAAPSATTTIEEVWLVGNDVSLAVFDSEESAKAYVSSFAASVSGGLSITNTPLIRLPSTESQRK